MSMRRTKARRMHRARRKHGKRTRRAGHYTTPVRKVIQSKAASMLPSPDARMRSLRRAHQKQVWTLRRSRRKRTHRATLHYRRHPPRAPKSARAQQHRRPSRDTHRLRMTYLTHSTPARLNGSAPSEPRGLLPTYAMPYCLTIASIP
mgnify:FL=1